MEGNYVAEPVVRDGVLADIRVVRAGRTWHLGGRHGADAELRRAADIPSEGVLPVFLGSGLGVGLAAHLRKSSGPVAVVDRETPILGLTDLRDQWRRDERIFWIDADAPDTAMGVLTRWQLRHGGLPFLPVLDPFYARLDPGYYRVLDERLAVSRVVDFWSRVRYPKFSGAVPRLLLLTSSYFLMGEMEAACRRLGYAVCFVQLPSQEIGSQEFVERVLSAVVEFRPDCILTINHLGVDKEGVLTDLLARMELPLASWFVDNPHLILYLYENLASEWVTIFTWDADNIQSLKARGFSRVHYLPLATDPHRFSPRAPGYVRDVAFVGNSMVFKVLSKLEQFAFPSGLVDPLEQLGAAFKESGVLSVAEFLREFPGQAALFEALPDMDFRLAYETVLTWQATLTYRLERVRQLLPFGPVLVGDEGWRVLLPRQGWSYHPEMNYYADLPGFYPATKINFNCTSQQMKGAVNQRVFDVPACGGFLLTDHRRQMEDLFVPGREVICYGEPEEIPELVRYYLAHGARRREISARARERVLAQHTYDLRLAELVRVMTSIYG